jgi:RNA polymerase sigma-70 factor (ECF subfamily)
VKVVGTQQPTVSDEELVLQVAGGHLASLGHLFDRYHIPMRRFLSRMQVREADLDDLVQTTFLQIPRVATRFDATRPVKGWLFGLATIEVKRHRRTLSRFARKLAAFAREPAHRASPSPADVCGDSQAARRAERALAALSEKKRDVFVMVVLEELPGGTVAHALGIPEGTVWTRLHHARRELADMLKEDEP